MLARHAPPPFRPGRRGRPRVLAAGSLRGHDAAAMKTLLASPLIGVLLLVAPFQALGESLELDIDAPPPSVDHPGARPEVVNQNLEYAKELLARGEYEDALYELDLAGRLPGNTLRIVADLHATRAQALLLKEPPDRSTARDLLVEMLHIDPEATLLGKAPPAVKTFVDGIRAEQVLVLHEPIAVARAGRPMRVRARVIDPKNEVTNLRLYYRAHGLHGYSMEPMTKGASGWTGYLREPALLAPEGVTDEYLIDYYITALNTSETVLDSNGSAAVPITAQISATRDERAGIHTGVDLTAVAEIREGPPPEPELAIAPTVPIYKRWYVWTAAGVVVLGVVTGSVLAATSNGDLPSPSLGQIQLP